MTLPQPLADPLSYNLGVVGFAAARPAHINPACPFVRVEMPVLHGEAYEMWPTARHPVFETRSGLISARDGGVTFGAMTIPDAEGDELAKRVRAAYEDLFAFAAGAPLLRLWNYMPRINQDSNGLERYRHFNLGRHQAFEKHYAGKLPPAASCLGTQGNTLAIYFLMADKPGTPIENPRQVAAYDYPAQYGPKSPNFSRALLGDPAGEKTLFISGTASIVGHQSLHAGDPEMQTRETLANIEALLDEARKLNFSPALTAARLKVYIREPRHFPVIRALVEAQFPLAEIVYLHADICRVELLVEIEAVIPGSA